MKAKKIMSGMLAVTMSAALFSGCAQKKTEEDNEVVWYMPKAIENMGDQKLVEDEVNKLLADKVDVKLKMRLIDAGSYDEKMNVIISSGEEFDICFTTSWTNSYLKNIQRNAFMDISAVLEEYGKAILEKSDARVLEALKSDGKLFAIPSQIPIVVPNSRVIKADLAQKYNFDYKNAQDIKSLEPFLEQIKTNEPGITPILVTGNSAELAWALSDRYNDDSIPGLRYDQETDEFIKYYDIPEVQDYYRTINDYYKKGYIAKDAMSKTDYMSEAKSGKYAVLNGTGAYTEDGSKSAATYGFGCAETNLGSGAITTPGVMTAMNAISTNCKKPEKAIQLLNAIWEDPQISNLLAYGIEGIHYTVDTSREDIFSVIPNSGKEQTWALWHNFIGPLWDQWDSPWNRVEALEEMKAANDTAETSEVFGFIFDSEPVKTEFAQVSAVIEEIKPVLITGSMPDFDEYMSVANKKLTDAKLDVLLEEANRQLDEWRKTK